VRYFGLHLERFSERAFGARVSRVGVAPPPQEIITDFADRGFDSIPSRLRDLGYKAIYIGADPNFDNQDIWLPRWYSKVIALVAGGTPATDRNIVNRAIEEIRQHDANAQDGPLFEFISTYSTHYPFSLPSDAGEQPLAASDGLEAQYRQVLRYTDLHVGDLVSFLATLDGMRDRTITIVVGDHGFYTDLRRTSGLPENDNVWTAAIISGPEDLLGPPRRVDEPASHVDMLPTILALVGDHRPTAALGGDLFGPPRNGSRTAFAVQPGGLRFDRDGYSVMVDARTQPRRHTGRVSGPVPAGDATALFRREPDAIDRVGERLVVSHREKSRLEPIISGPIEKEPWHFFSAASAVFALIVIQNALGNAPIDRFQSFGNRIPVVVAHECRAVFSEASTAILALEQPDQFLRQSACIAGRDQPRALGAVNKRRIALDAACDERLRADHGFQKDDAEALASERRCADDIRRLKERREFLVGDAPEKLHCGACLAGERHQPFAIRAIADDHEADAGHMLLDFRHRPNQVIDTFTSL
jgi:hypothetical protein